MIRASVLSLLGSLLALAPQAAEAQKVEREYGLKAHEVPAGVHAYLDSAYQSARRRKFYYDIGEDRTSIEAKFHYEGRRYSLEFDTTGRWLDTEVELPVDEIDDQVWAAVCEPWTQRFERFRVARVQEHHGRDGSHYFEVEVRARKDYEWTAYQYRLMADGTVLDEQEIILSPGHLSRW